MRLSMSVRSKGLSLVPSFNTQASLLAGTTSAWACSAIFFPADPFSLMTNTRLSTLLKSREKSVAIRSMAFPIAIKCWFLWEGIEGTRKVGICTSCCNVEIASDRIFLGYIVPRGDKSDVAVSWLKGNHFDTQ